MLETAYDNLETEGEWIWYYYSLLICETIIDNKVYAANNNNNYKDSDIRGWLNDYGSDGFLHKAFASDLIIHIRQTSIDNSADSTGYDPNSFACENTDDKIFLPSVKELTNYYYGFNTNFTYGDDSRVRNYTDYSQNSGSSKYWFTRSPHRDNANSVRIVNDWGSELTLAANDSMGIVPMLNLYFEIPPQVG